ncbi:MAG: NFACT RNA binding domain-containing protein [Bacteroidia bacterium]|nr:NFACT RNA binding domain-containing protein [Bacteroidia bacterium]
MHFHYFTLCHLRDFLNKEWKNKQIQECFSQNKNELIILSDSAALRIGCNTPLSYVIPVPDYSKAGKNVVSLFSELQGLFFKKAEVLPFERVMIFYFSGAYSLTLKMHRIQSNLILKKNDAVCALFNQSLKQDETFAPQPGPFQESLIAQLDSLDPGQDDKLILKVLREISPVFDVHFLKRWRLHTQSFSPSAALRECLKEVASPQFFVSKNKDGILFSLFPEEENIGFKHIDAALNFYLKAYFQYQAYNNLYTSLKKAILEPFKKLEGTYHSYLKTIQQLNHERSAEETGHLIFANLPRIEREQTELIVEDFYNENQPCKIKLKKDLSPAENAEAYFKKHKDRKAKLAYLEKEVSVIEDKLLEMEEKVTQFTGMKTPEQLMLTPKGMDNEPLRLLKVLEKQQTAEMMKKEFPYRYFEKDGWQIFIGKNAKNNDVLLKFADKNDWWLHAKEVSGSHVIIRQKSGQNLPAPVLEYAAGLAAWFSKSRTQSLVPVIYTHRKNIRKRKGSAAGEVVVSRENVVIIEPVKASSTEE